MEEEIKNLLEGNSITSEDKIRFIMVNHNREYPIDRLCKRLGITPSNYYKRVKNINKEKYIISSNTDKISVREIKEYIYKVIATANEYLNQDQVIGLLREHFNIQVSKKSLKKICSDIWIKEVQNNIREIYLDVALKPQVEWINSIWVMDIRNVYTKEHDEFNRLFLCVDIHDGYVLGYYIEPVDGDIDCLKVISSILKQEILQTVELEGVCIYSPIRSEFLKGDFKDYLSKHKIQYKMVDDQEESVYKIINKLFCEIKKIAKNKKIMSIPQYRDVIEEIVKEVNEKEDSRNIEGISPSDYRKIVKLHNRYLQDDRINPRELLEFLRETTLYTPE